MAATVHQPLGRAVKGGAQLCPLLRRAVEVVVVAGRKHIYGGGGGQSGVTRLDAAGALLLGRHDALAHRAVWSAVPLELRHDASRDALAAKYVHASERLHGATRLAQRLEADRALPAARLALPAAA